VARSAARRERPRRRPAQVGEPSEAGELDEENRTELRRVGCAGGRGGRRAIASGAPRWYGSDHVGEDRGMRLRVREVECAAEDVQSLW